MSTVPLTTETFDAGDTQMPRDTDGIILLADELPEAETNRQHSHMRDKQNDQFRLFKHLTNG